MKNIMPINIQEAKNIPEQDIEEKSKSTNITIKLQKSNTRKLS